MPNHNLIMPKYEVAREAPQTIDNDTTEPVFIEFDTVAFNNRNICSCAVPSSDVVINRDGIYTGRLTIFWDFNATGLRAVAMVLPTPDDPFPELPLLVDSRTGIASSGNLLPGQVITYPIAPITLIGDIGPIKAAVYQSSGGQLDVLAAVLVLRRMNEPDRIRSIVDL